ncbi:autoinducer binding domain-containing protein [Escherichia coli]|nr:autoinducer binding domain-containing protein [Escherichia coli]
MKKSRAVSTNSTYKRIDVPLSIICILSDFVFEKTQQTRFSLLFRKIYPIFDREIFVIDNYHSEWRNIYDKKKLWCSDPIVNIHRRSEPAFIAWGDDFFEGYSELLKHGEDFGFKYGVSFIINTLHGYECIISLSNNSCNITSQQLSLCELYYTDIYNTIIKLSLPHLVDANSFTLMPPVLTHIERIILTLVVDGFTSSEIARRIFITESAINFHIYNVIKKLGCRNRIQVVAKAIMLNLI